MKIQCRTLCCIRPWLILFTFCHLSVDLRPGELLKLCIWFMLPRWGDSSNVQQRSQIPRGWQLLPEAQSAYSKAAQQLWADSSPHFTQELSWALFLHCSVLERVCKNSSCSWFHGQILWGRRKIFNTLKIPLIWEMLTGFVWNKIFWCRWWEKNHRKEVSRIIWKPNWLLEVLWTLFYL